MSDVPRMERALDLAEGRWHLLKLTEGDGPFHVTIGAETFTVSRDNPATSFRGPARGTKAVLWYEGQMPPGKFDLKQLGTVEPR